MEQHPLAVGAPVSRYEYITVFRIKQDAQAVFVFASIGIGGENVQICLAVGQKQVTPGVNCLFVIRRQNAFLRWEDEDIRFYPAQKIFRRAGVIPVAVGQNQPVQPGNALAQKRFCGNVRGVGVAVPAAVHHVRPAFALQQNALPLPHIQHRYPGAVQHRLYPGCQQRQAQSQRAAAQQNAGAAVPAQ